MQIITGKRPKVTVRRHKQISSVHDVVFSDAWANYKEFLEHIERLNEIPEEAIRSTEFDKDQAMFVTYWVWYIIEVD